MEWLALILILIVMALALKRTSKARNFPPGPPAFPLIGCFPSLLRVKANTRPEILMKLSERYGPVLGLQLGLTPTVVLNGYEAIKHAMHRTDLAVRPNIVPPELHCFGRRIGVFFNDGEEWREQRRFALRHLRDFGFGRRSMEQYIHDELSSLIDLMNTTLASADTEFDLLSILPNVVAINIMWSIIGGKRDENDTEFWKFKDAITRFFHEGSASDPRIYIPFLQNIPFINYTYKKVLNYVTIMQRYIQMEIDKHMATYDENNTRDFMDVYIKEMKSNPNSTFTNDQLCATCMDLFAAATDTTAAAVSYALRFLLWNENAQDKLRKQIHEVIGPNRLPCMEDIPKLPYAEAVMTETLRMEPPVALTPPHSVKQDTEFMGHIIPKDTFIILNLVSAHMDPKLWGDPEIFRPERFIAEDGSFKRSEYFIAFGQGPRVCMGESLARYTTILYLIALIQHFQFQPKGGKLPLNDHIEGFTTSPGHFHMTIKHVNIV